MDGPVVPIPREAREALAQATARNRCPAGRDWEYVSLQTTFNPGDQLIVAGQEANLERFGRSD